MVTSFLRRAGMIILLAHVFISGAAFAQGDAQAVEDERITVVGSRIVARVFEGLADASGVEANLAVNVTGTDSGLEAFCSGQADITLANRPITADEDTICSSNGVDYVELLIGHEVLAFVSNPDNTFLQCLTAEQLNTIFAPSAEGQITNWTQINEEFADLPLGVHIPGEDSITFALLDEAVSGDGLREDAVSEDIPAIIEAVAQDQGTLGAVSLAAAEAAAESVRILEVDSGAGAGCVQPSADNVEARAYTTADRLFVYANRASLDKSGLREVLAFAVSSEAASVVQSLGATPPTSAAYETNSAILAGAEDGRQFSVDTPAFAIPPGVSGQINIGGAANGFTYIENLSQNFNTLYPGATLNTNIEGQPAGFRRLCNGEIDIAIAYTDMSEEQARNCAANNITLLVLELGSQATVLVANGASTYLQCLTTDQITTIWGAASADTITRWSQVSEAFPDEAMTLFAPNAGHPATDLMLLTAAVESSNINRDDTEHDADPLYRAAATANVEGALTYMSWAEYAQVLDSNQQNILLVSVDAGNGCVTPNPESITDGSYPLARPGKLIVNQSALARVEVMSFLWYALSDENLQALEDAGFQGLTFGDLAAGRSTLQDAYVEASAKASQAEATAEPGAESTAEPEAAVEATEEPGVESEATEEATEASGG